jgi:hypothetical protein
MTEPIDLGPRTMTPAVAAIYNEALAKLDGDESPMHFGPAHIVWADDNFEDRHIHWCLQRFDEHWKEYCDDHYLPGAPAIEGDAKIVRESLEKLLLIPEEERFDETD